MYICRTMFLYCFYKNRNKNGNLYGYLPVWGVGFDEHI